MSDTNVSSNGRWADGHRNWTRYPFTADDILHWWTSTSTAESPEPPKKEKKWAADWGWIKSSVVVNLEGMC